MIKEPRAFKGEGDDDTCVVYEAPRWFMKRLKSWLIHRRETRDRSVHARRGR